jgi:hypothetical protein
MRLAKAHRDNQLTETHHLIYSAQINTHDILESVRIGVYLEACLSNRRFISCSRTL